MKKITTKLHTKYQPHLRKHRFQRVSNHRVQFQLQLKDDSCTALILRYYYWQLLGEDVPQGLHPNPIRNAPPLHAPLGLLLLQALPQGTPFLPQVPLPPSRPSTA